MKVFFFKKSTLKLLAVFVILAALCTVNISGLPVASIYFGQRLKKVPIYNVQTDEKKVAISFDAAWGADKTEEIMASKKKSLKNMVLNTTAFHQQNLIAPNF